MRALVDHVVDEIRQFAAVTAGGERHHDGADVIGDDWSAAHRAAADELLAAWRRSGALDRPQRPPFREIPALWAVGQHVTELVIHAWDIARATGQQADLDPELGLVALRCGRETLRPEFRGDETEGHHIAAEVPVPDDAPLYDRIAAFGGRDPLWGRSSGA
ncbi:TIGR03086 family metal-binding protein [Planomonospora corallina]|uniref:TIGR03086 family metal-binding protein n=1 Tax=Planomonospora corallina TaxID=1806052 RepID=A0ABV8I5X3_9ACTN